MINMSNKTIPAFDKEVTKISQVNPRLKKLLPDKQIICYRESTSDIRLAWAELDSGKPVIKQAHAWCPRLYNFSLENWNEMLQHIENDMIFPGDARFYCYKCGCPDIEHYGNQKNCKNCGETYVWHVC